MRGRAMKSRVCGIHPCWLPALMLWLGVGGRQMMVARAECIPVTGCTALAYYITLPSENPSLYPSVELLSNIFQVQYTTDSLLAYNNKNQSEIYHGTSLYIPFNCTCASNGQLAHQFSYTVAQGDDVPDIVENYYHNLTTVEAVCSASSVNCATQYVQAQFILSIPVNCSCGDPTISLDYGLFATYVVQPTDQLTTIASNFSVNADLISEYNSGVKSLVPYSTIFIPTRNLSGVFPPFSGTSSSVSPSQTNIGVIAGAVTGALVLAVAISFLIFLGRKYLRSKKPRNRDEKQESGKMQHLIAESLSLSKSSIGSEAAPPMMRDMKSVEFSYEDLAAVTDNFHVSHKIGQGGFASVYYGVIYDQKLAIKKMNTQASKEFLAELQVLTNVHHTNLVQLIGFCTTSSLFLVYEFIENGTLDYHLRRKNFEEKPPLSWSQRVQIALDAARGLEYIHEHIKPSYIHRDIKTANILLDSNFRAKVADFGLAKLTESGSGTGIVGTFGYMPPEYALYGEVSPKVDVFAFGVVLFELLSGRVAISGLASHGNSLSRSREGRTLKSLFESTLNDPNGKAMLYKFIDPALKDDYPIEAVWKMAQLARRCTQEYPDSRPSMRNAVVQLMTLATMTQEWDDRGNYVD